MNDIPDLFTTLSSPVNTFPILSVSELSKQLRATIEECFPILKIRGEISTLTKARSGHVYLSLKDSNAVIDAVCWKTTARKLPFQPENGMEIIATGYLTIYAERSRYQLIINHMEIAGEGALLKQLEERKKKLQAEGIFALERKKDLPAFPQKIGLITSPSGAVLQDMLHRFEERFPCNLLLWPVNVQGQNAAKQIIAAIKGFNAKNNIPKEKPDLLIIARGGGSIEDLWCFNEENVARAIAASHIPIISAIGHETDITLADLAADKRAPTPTAAAEFAVPLKTHLLQQLHTLKKRSQQQIKNILFPKFKQLQLEQQRLNATLHQFDRMSFTLEDKKTTLHKIITHILHTASISHQNNIQKLHDPSPKVDILQQQYKALSKRHNSALKYLCESKQTQLEKTALQLNSLSIEQTLKRGFTLTLDQQGRILPSVKTLSPKKKITLKFKDGTKTAIVK